MPDSDFVLTSVNLLGPLVLHYYLIFVLLGVFAVHLGMGQLNVALVIALDRRLKQSSLAGKPRIWANQIAMALMVGTSWLVLFILMLLPYSIYIAADFNEQYPSLEYVLAAVWAAIFIVGSGYPIFSRRQELKSAGVIRLWWKKS